MFINSSKSVQIMKLPKQVKRLCPTCKKHTQHKVSLVKRRSASSLSHGSKIRARLRGQARGYGGWGRYSKPAVGSFKMTGSKVSKKGDIRYQCEVCKKMHAKKSTFRAKKIEVRDK
jgi:large subunit ribosomal protein L44e